MTHASTKQPDALRLADIVERLNVGVHSQAIAEEYSAAAAELRRLHERDIQADAQIKELLQTIEDLERCSEMLSQRIVEMEEQVAAIGAGGVEPLRKRKCLHQIAEPARWYCLSADGMATLCISEEDARESAKEYDTVFPMGAPYRAVQLVPVDAANSALHQHLEAVGAGGVEPPRKQMAAVKESLTPEPTVNQQLTDQLRGAAKMMPAFTAAAKNKLDTLLAQGYRITGYAIERDDGEWPPQRGFITHGGFVGWWQPHQLGDIGAVDMAQVVDSKEAAQEESHG